MSWENFLSLISPTDSVNEAKTEMQILNSLIPIFAVIGLGMLLRWREFLTADSTSTLNRFAYWYGLPFFLFYKLATTESVGISIAGIPGALLVSTVLMVITSCVLTVVVGVSAERRGATVQASFRGNLAFMGLPLIFFLVQELPDVQKNSIETAVIVGLGPVILIYNVFSVLVLSIWNNDSENLSARKLFTNVISNPLILACILGVAYRLFQLPLPTALERTCSIVGSSAFPIALVGIGSQLKSISGESRWRESLLPSAVKCIVSPLIGFVVGKWFGLEGIELQAIVLLCGMPTAVSSFVLADQMKSDPDFAASAVIYCTAISLPTLSILIWLLGG